MSALSPVLITGARRGLGLQLCKQFFQNGYELCATGRDTHALGTSLIENQITASTLPLNFSHPLSSFNQELTQLPKKVSTIIHNASPYGDETIQNVSEQSLQGYGNFMTNNISLAQFAAKHLESNGRFIIIGSIAGIPGYMKEGRTMYSIYKASLTPLAEAFNLECKQENQQAILILLGNMREKTTGKEALLEEDVAQNIFELFQSKSVLSQYKFIAETDPLRSSQP